MKARDDQLLLSPSDVTAYLACSHLTTLGLAVARGQLVELAAGYRPCARCLPTEYAGLKTHPN